MPWPCVDRGFLRGACEPLRPHLRVPGQLCVTPNVAALRRKALVCGSERGLHRRQSLRIRGPNFCEAGPAMLTDSTCIAGSKTQARGIPAKLPLLATHRLSSDTPAMRPATPLAAALACTRKHFGAAAAVESQGAEMPVQRFALPAFRGHCCSRPNCCTGSRAAAETHKRVHLEPRLWSTGLFNISLFSNARVGMSGFWTPSSVL